MKKKNLIALIITVLDVLLLAVLIFLYVNTDRTRPVITFSQNDIVYNDGMDISSLLDGIEAVDDRDGDISDKVIIEKISDYRQQDIAVVFYAVSDSSGNVGRASKEYRAVFKDMAKEEK